jgi:hypothetical protein
MLSCWTCKGVELKHISKQKYECSICEDVYYGCVNCPDSLDWEDNDKGIFCIKCRDHLCASCWQHNGIMFPSGFIEYAGGVTEVLDSFIETLDFAEDGYLCKKCFKIVLKMV